MDTKRHLLWQRLGCLMVLLCLGLILAANRWWGAWTGFAGKTLWDWFQLLIIPLVLALIAVVFNQANTRTERQIALDKQREDLLQSYLDRMSDLLLEKGLRTSSPDAEVRNIARARTISILIQLNGKRAEYVFAFLQEAGLTKEPQPIISFAQAQFSEVNWSHINLRNVNLSGANFDGANLSGANLTKTNLNGANFDGANLSRAHLSGADLSLVDLSHSNLRNALLLNAHLNGAKLDFADLTKAHFNGADLSKTHFCGARLHKATFGRAKFDGASLNGAELNKAYLGGVDLSKAYFDKASLSRAYLSKKELAFLRTNPTKLQ